MDASKSGQGEKELSAFQKWAKRNELPRKILHGSIAPLTIGLYLAGAHIRQVTRFLNVLIVPIAALEVLRFQFPGINKLYIKVVGSLMREREKETHVNGVIWYIVGLILVFSTLPKDLCVLSVLLLSWADLSASTFGRAFGKYTPKLVGDKSLAGSIAAFLSGICSTYLLYRFLLPQFPYLNNPTEIMWTETTSRLSLPVYSVIVGLVASVTELFPVIDDNLSIPVLSGATLWLVLKITNYF